jgi:hypothetical protein
MLTHAETEEEKDRPGPNGLYRPSGVGQDYDTSAVMDQVTFNIGKVWEWMKISHRLSLAVYLQPLGASQVKYF